MKYDINLKNIKQSVNNLADSLKEYNIPRNQILEAFARSIFFKNWNTLQGIGKKPHIIEHLDIQKRYFFEIDANVSREELLKKLKSSFEKANANLELINLIEDKKSFHMEINVLKSDKNILTAMFLFAEELKSHNVTRFDYCRVVCEKESFMAMYK